jgi:AcrR family transcriptional regulator
MAPRRALVASAAAGGAASRAASRAALEDVSPQGLFDDVQPENARLMLLAAISAFARHGYHATTTREIASALQLSPAAVYSHFPTKADLLFEATLRGNREILERLEAAVAGADGPVDRIAAIVRVSVLWHAGEHVFANAINTNFRALDEQRLAPVMKMRRAVTALVEGEIKRGVAAGVFRTVDIKGATIALLRMVDVAPWYSEKGPMTPERLADVYVDLILHMLGAGDAPA